MTSSNESTIEVHIIKPHRIITQIIAVFKCFGMWERDNQFLIIKLLKRLIHFLISASLCFSLFSGSYLSDDYNESFFLTAAGIGSLLQVVKLIYVLTKRDQISSFLDDISVTDLEEFSDMQQSLNNFAKFGYVYIFILVIGVVGFYIITLPVFSTDLALPLNIGFPLDWRNNRLNYWLAHSFIAIGLLMAAVAYFFTIVYWYIMFNCSIKYKILGNQFRTLGRTTSTFVCKKDISPKEQQEHFSQRFVELITAHQKIQKFASNCR